MKRRTHEAGEFKSLNVTPLIDVVMCLIVFFLIVGKMAHDQSAGVRLPSSALGSQTDAGPMVVVSVAPLLPGEDDPEAFAPARAARVLVQGKPARDEARLRAAIVGAFADANAARYLPAPGAPAPARDETPVPVQVRADRDAPYGLIEPVLKACQDLRLTSVLLVTERGEAGSREGRR